MTTATMPSSLKEFLLEACFGFGTPDNVRPLFGGIWGGMNSSVRKSCASALRGIKTRTKNPAIDSEKMSADIAKALDEGMELGGAQLSGLRRAVELRIERKLPIYMGQENVEKKQLLECFKSLAEKYNVTASPFVESSDEPLRPPKRVISDDASLSFWSGALQKLAEHAVATLLDESFLEPERAQIAHNFLAAAKRLTEPLRNRLDEIRLDTKSEAHPAIEAYFDVGSTGPAAAFISYRVNKIMEDGYEELAQKKSSAKLFWEAGKALTADEHARLMQILQNDKARETLMAGLWGVVQGPVTFG